MHRQEILLQEGSHIQRNQHVAFFEKMTIPTFSLKVIWSAHFYTKNSIKTIVIGLNETIKHVVTIYTQCAYAIVATSRQLHESDLARLSSRFYSSAMSFLCSVWNQGPDYLWA